MDSLTRSRLWFSSPPSHCKSGVALLKPVALTGIGRIANETGARHWGLSAVQLLRPGKKSRWHKYFCWTENTSSVKTWMSLVHFPMANRGLSVLWLITGASPSASFLSALILQQTLYPSSSSRLTFNPCYRELRLPVYALDEGPYEGRKPENTSYGEGAFSLWQRDERLMTVTWPPYLHASCSRAGEVLVGLYLGALVVHGISSAAHCRFACGFILL